MSYSTHGKAVESPLTYRADIDGLRAIAVLLVVGYHAFPSWINGGFIGVDVFFVISGYLISTIIYTSIKAERFTFADFYRKRIKRIFPALTVVSIATLAFGSLVLLDEEFKLLGKHIAAGAAFVSNFSLWSESGYFDSDAELKPLLHLWSLAIEEQYYIVWPIILLVFHRFRWSAGSAVITILVVSLASSIYLAETDRTAAYYSPLSRFWELMIGCWLALLTIRRPKVLANYKEAQSILGMTLLAGGAFFIQKEYAFPGAWALFPVLGTFLLISAGPNALINKHILSSGIFVWFGLISYPLYLWHWPLLSFARIIESGMPDREIRFLLVGLSIFLAWITYQLVEQPLRKNQIFPKIQTQVLAISLSIICVVGLAIWLGAIKIKNITNNEIAEPYKTQWQITEDCLQLYSNVFSPKFSSDEDFCVVGNSNKSSTHFVIGDSHSNRLLLGLSQVDPNTRYVNLARGACNPLSSINDTLDSHCAKTITQILSIAESQAEKIYVTAYWDRHFTKMMSQDKEKVQSETSAFVTRLAQSGKQVIIVIDNPTLPFNPRQCLKKPLFAGVDADTEQCRFKREHYEKEKQTYIDFLNKASQPFNNVTVFDPTDIYCDDSYCNGTANGKMLYSDPHHLSRIGTEALGKKLMYSVQK